MKRSICLASVAAMWASSLVGFLAPATTFAGLQLTGVNLSGAEFGATPTVGNTGVYNSDYTYPTASEVDYFISKGLNVFRLPIRWERLQKTANGPLDATELSRLNTFVNYATSKGAHVIVEPHNFARYYPLPVASFQNSTTGLIGNDVSNATFADFWSKVSTQYKSNGNVIFNLMNEPANMDTDVWVSAANAAIAAIRATGATNQIQVPGNRYTGANSWNTSGNSSGTGRSNAVAMLNIVDPGNNYVIEAHQYFDNDGSGTSTTISGNNVNIGAQRLAALTTWLRANNKKGYLGEFAFANSTMGTGAGQIGDEALTNLLTYLDANSDVWTGWNWWGGGPWWGNYMFALDPANGVDRAAMTYLSAHAVGVPEPTAACVLLTMTAGLSLRRRSR